MVGIQDFTPITRKINIKYQHSRNNTPHSKMAAILVFFCFHANWPLWPHSRLNILLNFPLESEATRATFYGNKKDTKNGGHFGIRCISPSQIRVTCID